MNKHSATTESQDNIMLGAAYAAAAFFLLALMGACVKLLSDANHHVMEIAFYRNLVPFLPMIAYAVLWRKTELLIPKNPPLLALRVAIGITGLIATFSALASLPMSDATVIFMTSNLIIPILAYFILKEHVGPHRWIAIAAGFIGVIMVAGPTGQVNLTGVLYALAAAGLQASIQIILRRLKNENAFTVTFYFISGGIIIPGLFMPWVAEIPTQRDILLFLGVGISGGFAQYCLTSAYKYAPASIAAPFNYTGLLWATGLDVLIWKHIPGWPVFVGGAIIIAAKLYILHREALRKNKDKKTQP
ncbi:MAG: DMT family transporter [Alphaproteobacteria bacterium]|nr:DMT family transporter [Alphaproteobacteria bacterium]